MKNIRSCRWGGLRSPALLVLLAGLLGAGEVCRASAQDAGGENSPRSEGPPRAKEAAAKDAVAKDAAARFAAQFSDKATTKAPQRAASLAAASALPARPRPAVVAPVVFHASFDPALAGQLGDTGPLSTAESVGELLPMVVGRSMFINMSGPASGPTGAAGAPGGPGVSGLRLRRVYVSNPAVLDSYTANARQIVITAKAPGSSSLVLWDEAGRSQAYLVVSSLDVAGLRTAMRLAFPQEKIDVQADADNLSVSGTVSGQAAIDAALKMAGVYSKNVVDAMLLAPPHLAQVRLKVRIVEIDRSRLAEFGVNFFSLGSNPSSTTTGQFPSLATITNSVVTVSDPLNLYYYNSSLGVGVTIKDLASKNVLQILAEPTITAMSGEKASFLSGGEFPFPIIQGGSAGTAASVTIQFRPYGVKLEFTPIVNPDGTILLKVAPEVSALDYTNAVTISGYTVPALSTRRADTAVELRDGQSFAISGLLDHRTTDVLNAVPVVGNLPVIWGPLPLQADQAVGGGTGGDCDPDDRRSADRAWGAGGGPVFRDSPAGGPAVRPKDEGHDQALYAGHDPAIAGRGLWGADRIEDSLMEQGTDSDAPTLAVLTVGLNEEAIEQVLQVAGTLQREVVPFDCGGYLSPARYQFFPQQVKSAAFVVAVVEWDQDPAAAVETATLLHQAFHNKIAIVALSAALDTATVLEAMRCGFTEMLAMPLDSGELADAFLRIEQRWPAVYRRGKDHGQRFIVFRGQGRSGDHDAAGPSGVYLTKFHKKKVLLIDHHLEFGHVCLYLGLGATQYDFYELLTNVDRMDKEFWRGFCRPIPRVSRYSPRRAFTEPGGGRSPGRWS